MFFLVGLMVSLLWLFVVIVAELVFLVYACVYCIGWFYACVDVGLVGFTLGLV